MKESAFWVMTINLDGPFISWFRPSFGANTHMKVSYSGEWRLTSHDLLKLLHKALRILGGLRPTDRNHSTVDRLSVLVLPTVEEGTLVSLGHFQDGESFSLNPPLLRLGADGLAGEFGDGSGVTGVGHALDDTLRG
jgi:hypothetical protein